MCLVWGALRRSLRQTMGSRNLVAALRRDASFIWLAAIAIVFISFAGLALLAALIDLTSLS